MLEEVCFKPDFLVPILAIGVLCWFAMTAIHRPLLSKVKDIDEASYKQIIKGFKSSWVERWWHIPSDAIITIRLIKYIFRVYDPSVIGRTKRTVYIAFALITGMSLVIAVVTVVWFIVCVATHIKM